MITDSEAAVLLELVEKGHPQVETMDAAKVRALFRTHEKRPELPVEAGGVEDWAVAADDYGDGDHGFPVRHPAGGVRAWWRVRVRLAEQPR